jgi:hypothetical protein
MPQETTPGSESTVVPPEAIESARAAGVTAQTLFAVLEEPGNRYVLSYLLDADGPVTWYDLVEYVVEETDPSMDISDTEFRGRIATHLLHERLPELAELAFIEYREGEHRIQPGEGLEVVRPYLDLVRKHDL